MNCVKCGRETAEEQVFCDVCLGEMENYPVKPGTAVHIPTRNPMTEPKKAHPRRKSVLPPSEQIALLKKKLRRTRILAVVLLLICGSLCLAIGRAVEELDIQRLLGQNYHTEEMVKPTEASSITETVVSQTP